MTLRHQCSCVELELEQPRRMNDGRTRPNDVGDPVPILSQTVLVPSPDCKERQEFGLTRAVARLASALTRSAFTTSERCAKGPSENSVTSVPQGSNHGVPINMRQWPSGAADSDSDFTHSPLSRRNIKDHSNLSDPQQAATKLLRVCR